MVIRFLCPNGHKIHCPDDRSGKAAKCPKCGVRFQIPEVSEIEAAASSISLPRVSDSGASLPMVGAGSAEPAEQQIEFLCPNGHHLHGPASLQGHPGQCPECGAKFRVPSYDDEEEGLQEQEPQPQIEFTEVDSVEDSKAAAESAKEPPTGEAAGDQPMPRLTPAEDTEPSNQATPGRSLVAVFEKLWEQKSQGAVIELQLSDGEKIVPDSFSDELSRGSHGVFGVRESDGSHTLTAIPWESITLVIARGVKQLPEGMRS